MRVLRAYVDGYRNLRNVEAAFDGTRLTTVLIGENGSGKSNLIEAIVAIFRAYDLGEQTKLKFTYEILYQTREFDVRLTNRQEVAEKPTEFIASPSSAGGAEGAIERNFIDSRTATIGPHHLPDLIFGYYSGTGRRLERLFDDHQARYYSVINKERPDDDYEAAGRARRLFYCRPIHGALALLAYFAKPGESEGVRKILSEKLGISGFHSALTHFKEPSWFNHALWQRTQNGNEGNGDASGRGRRSFDKLSQQAWDVWGARGPAGHCARDFRDLGFHPLTLAGKVVDDYRQKPRTEAQLACFVRDEAALANLAASYDSDQQLFSALEAADISDLIRQVFLWVTRAGVDDDDISFNDLSDGERQLLMVLGLIRVSRGREALFLLDEPDTHLNPAWQLTYLELIREWTEVSGEEGECQIIMTTHNPLTIAALEAAEVRVMVTNAKGDISVEPPRIDPRGLGFAGVLTDIFGLSSSLDKPTQSLIDRRNELARQEDLSPALAKEFAIIKEQLRHLGFLYEERDKLYGEFLRQLDSVELAETAPLSPEQLREREKETRRIVEELLNTK